MHVTNLDTYFIKLLDTKPKDLLKEFKDMLQTTLKFMSSQYILNKEDKDEYKAKHFTILSEGYELTNKINSLLHILIIVDESQTNKYKYEECLSYHMSPSKFVNLFLDINPNEFDIELKTIIDTANLKTDAQIDAYKEVVNKKMNYNFIEKVNSFNSFINDYILSLTRVIVAIKKTNI